jgi:hypothetical protein
MSDMLPPGSLVRALTLSPISLRFVFGAIRERLRTRPVEQGLIATCKGVCVVPKDIDARGYVLRD